MNKLNVKTVSILLFALFMSLFMSHLYEGITTMPLEGDSLAYHIPIAQSVLTLKIFDPVFYLGFYPGNGEVILSVLLLLNLPVNIFNIIAWILLFVALIKLGRTFGLDFDTSMIYSVFVSCVHGIIRWLNSQIIDIWLGIFFVLSLVILHTFTGRRRQFIMLGIAFGLTIGTKYSGPLFIVVLLIIYFNKIRKYLSLVNVVLFFIPLSILGVSWYLRNIFITGNPIYPQSILFFKGMPSWSIFNIVVWEAIVSRFLLFINAVTAEYGVWFFLMIITFVYYLFFLRKKIIAGGRFKLLTVIGICNLIIFLFLPTSYEYNIIVSSMRYSYPAFIPLMLAIFLFFINFKKFNVLVLLGFCNIVLLPSVSYRPKIIIPLSIITLLFFYRGEVINLIRKHL